MLSKRYLKEANPPLFSNETSPLKTPFPFSSKPKSAVDLPPITTSFTITQSSILADFSKLKTKEIDIAMGIIK
jgi:hypothetical protein